MNNGEMPERQLARYNTRRSSVGSAHKPYEHMLLKELPGVKRSNAPMHAVLESALEDSLYNGMHEAQKVRNHALIHYLASLANSNNNDDVFDFDFVQSLIQNGANVNCTDRNGQTIFHEVARSWNLDVALFLLENGADINRQDKFGRSPLHVAAAVDYADMVRFLVKHKADIDIATFGEQQMPIHYAAKNDACRSLKMLLGYGANIDSRDSKNRTPLQVAAEMNRAKSAKLLVQHGAPAGVHDNVGNSALSLLIEKLPDVAIEALDQFHSVSTINRKEFFFLNYLEGNRLQDPKSPAYSALEIAVQNHEFDIILHPVMKRFIDVKWQKFGRKGAVTNLCLNLLYAIMWTILAVTSPTEGDELYLPWSRKAWRLVISVIVCLMTINEIRKQITGTIRTRNHQKKWISWRASELEEDLQFCHPRWPQEEMYLKSEIKAIRDTPLISSSDSWIYFDWFSLFLILGTIASHVVFFNINSNISRVIYARFITVLLLVLWIRIMQYARPFEGAGPFVAIFGHVSKDIINWGTLTLLITIPYACAFWITFGEGSRNPVESYSDVSSLLYELFSMIVVNDHDFEALQAADATMARLLCGSYIAFMAIINLNILIALLSDTFTRVYGNAVANAVMQRAKTILYLEKSLSKKGRHAYEEFIKNFGSPETVELQRDISANNDRDEQKATDLLKESVQEIHQLIHERFGKHYGEGKKSDLDHIKEHLEKINKGSVIQRGKCDYNGIQRKVDVMQKILVKISKALKVNISDLDNNPQSSDDDDTLVSKICGVEQSIQESERSGKYKGWDYQKSYEEVTERNMRHCSPEQQLWAANNAALNEGYQFEEEKSAIARKAKDSFRRGTPKIRGCVDHGQSDGSNHESVDTGRTNRRKLGAIHVGESSRDEEYISPVPSDSDLIPHRQVRDQTHNYRSRPKREQLRTEVYQKRLRPEDEQSTHEKRRGAYFSREMPDDGMSVKRDRSPQSAPDKISLRRQVQRSESMPLTRLRDDLRHTRPRESYYYNVRRNSPGNLNTELFTRQMAERRRDKKENIPRSGRKHSSERRSWLDEKSSSGSLRKHTNRQPSPTITVTYPSDRTQQGSESDQYYEEPQRHPPDEPRPEVDSEISESELEGTLNIGYKENPANAYSDNDVIQKRARSFREKRYLEDWDNRSVKSVAF